MFRFCLAAVLTFGLATAAGAEQDPPRDWTWEWTETDFSRASVPFAEIFSGGVRKDGIPALDSVVMLPATEDRELQGPEPVVTVEIEGAVPRAYPIRYLTWHEIVNDDTAAFPIAVTFCPLCNSALVFDRRVGGEVLDFGVSGKLRFSDMVMYDRQTESWWQQFTGEAIVGEMLGTQLTSVVNWMESFDAFLERNPDGLVMQRPQGFTRAYGANPYAGYDSSGWPFLYRGETPPHGIAPLARVIRVEERAWPLERLSRQEEITEAGVTITWDAGMTSALDGRDIAASRDVGQIRVRDAQSGADLVHEVVFAFAFHAFLPDGEWMLGE